MRFAQSGRAPAAPVPLVVLPVILALLAGCGGPLPSPAGTPGATASPGAVAVLSWPIAADVVTTVERQVLPVTLPAGAPQLNPDQVALYEPSGYTAWQAGPGLPYVTRTDLAPTYAGPAASTRLLSFFTFSDIHVADKESPSQPIYAGSSAGFAPSGPNLSSAYSPVLLSTTHVLDAAVQTVNALHRRSPFDFGLSLGDDVNNTQYNELRWFIDVMDGKVITPSSGAHAGATTIDYQRPFQAAGLDRSIPWYQVLGNHDQFWVGSAFETAAVRQTHIASTILDFLHDPTLALKPPVTANGYFGVIDGSTRYGDVIGAGLASNFATPPTVVADPDRRSLASDTSSSQGWLREFFTTTSSPVGHGYSQADVDADMTSYSFVPRAGIPVRLISLDDTCKGAGQPAYAMACLDATRLDWLRAQLQQGQDAGQLMIIAAHIPIRPQVSMTDPSPYHLAAPATEDAVLALLHQFPNMVMWISGHLHGNTVTAQPYNAADPRDHPELGFWEVETPSLRDFPQQLRTIELRRNGDNTISIVITDVDPAVAPGSPAAKSRGYAIGAQRIFGATAAQRASTASGAYNAVLVKQLTPAMTSKLAALR